MYVDDDEMEKEKERKMQKLSLFKSLFMRQIEREKKEWKRKNFHNKLLLKNAHGDGKNTRDRCVCVCAMNE